MSEKKINYPHELAAALENPKGAMSAYLELRSDEEIAADIRALVHCNTSNLRDEFAAKAMQGMASTELYFGTYEKPYNPWTFVVEQAYKAADAMLSERQKPRVEGV